MERARVGSRYLKNHLCDRYSRLLHDKEAANAKSAT